MVKNMPNQKKNNVTPLVTDVLEYNDEQNNQRITKIKAIQNSSHNSSSLAKEPHGVQFRHGKSKRDKSQHHTMPAIFRVLFSILFLIIISVIFTWFILWRQNMQDVNETVQFIERKPILFLYSSLIIFLLSSTLAALLWRPFLAAGIIFSIVSVITFAHMEKFKVRQIPLLPEDIQMVGQAETMMEFVDVWSIVRLAAGIVLILVATWLIDHYARKVVGIETKTRPWFIRFALVPRVSLALVSLTTLVLVSAPIARHKSSGDNMPWWIQGLDLVAWNQTENYELNGFVIGFLYNIGSLQVPEPVNYSKESINQVISKYEEVKSKDNTRVPLSDKVDNIIFVMNESFYDPEVLGGNYLHTGGDVVPNIHKIFQKYPSGYMYSPEYGGNTANVEFAAFTSLSNYWANTIPYVTAISQVNNLPGLVRNAKDNNYNTTAIHSFDGSMYKRNFIYANMGFDEFLDVNKMTHTQKENNEGYVSDGEVYQEVLDILKDGNKKHLVAAITMQNHSPYDSAHYEDYHFHLLAPAESDNAYSIESSFESLHRSDKYLGDLIAELDKLEERTIMIWFGDHAAGVLDSYINSDNKTLSDLAHLTPYFIYANFELDNDFTVKEVAKINSELGFNFSTKGVDLPTVTPNCLSNILYNLLGVEKPAMLYMLDEICEKTPILAQSYFADKTPSTYPALVDYELVSYDILNGKRYLLEH